MKIKKFNGKSARDKNAIAVPAELFVLRSVTQSGGLQENNGHFLCNFSNQHDGYTPFILDVGLWCFIPVGPERLQQVGQCQQLECYFTFSLSHVVITL